MRKIPEVACETCGKTFRYHSMTRLEKRKHHFCSAECAGTAQKSAICPICGKIFVTNSDRVKYCSRECQHVSQKKYANKAERRKAAKARYIEKHRDELAASAEMKKARRAELKAEREALMDAAAEKKRLLKIHPCAQCGAETDRPKYCSDRCQKTSYNNRKDKKRRAKLRNALVDGNITLADVFRNDMGMCYICGKPCLWDDYVEDAGTIICGPCYPSIDHVVPLSKGGKHSWENVRLACRKCNSEKSDHIPPPLGA